MRPGSVVVDLAAEAGGNCEATRPGESITCSGVLVHGPLNLPSTIPVHASQMYARNISNFLMQLIREGALHLDLEDTLQRSTLITRHGEVLHEAAQKAISDQQSAVSAQ
jgi:NAD(P) transhydrogenase subunit alpha